MCSSKKPSKLLQFFQLVTLGLFFASLLSLGSCSNHPTDANETNACKSDLFVILFDWSNNIQPSNDSNTHILHWYSESSLYCEILLPCGKTFHDYANTIIENLDKTNRNNVFIVNQLKKLFKKSAFELGIRGIVDTVDIQVSLIYLLCGLFDWFEVKNEKLVKKEIKNNETIVEQGLLRRLFVFLFNSLINTIKLAYEANVYLPHDQDVFTFVRDCVLKVNAKIAKSNSTAILNAEIASKFLLEQMLKNLKFKPTHNTESFKLSEIIAELTTYGLKDQNEIIKHASDKFKNTDFNITTDFAYENWFDFHKIYVTFSNLVSIKSHIDIYFLLREYFTKIYKDFDIAGKDEFEVFPKLIAAAFSTNQSQRQLFNPEEEPSSEGLFYKMVTFEIQDLEKLINAALENRICKKTDKSGNLILSVADEKVKHNDNSSFLLSKVGIGIAIMAVVCISIGLRWYFSK